MMRALLRLTPTYSRAVTRIPIPITTRASTIHNLHQTRPTPTTSQNERPRSSFYYGTQTIQGQVPAGPATGAGTGVLIAAQMFGSQVKANPTESEAVVAADRAEVDPLPPELRRTSTSTIRLGASGEDAAPRPTESEEDVVADPGREDPLRR
ncbi:hypothetical protein VTK56DRAFT_6115 [Thermocarpiscus australiensis]